MLFIYGCYIISRVRARFMGLSFVLGSHGSFLAQSVSQVRSISSAHVFLVWVGFEV